MLSDAKPSRTVRLLSPGALEISDEDHNSVRLTIDLNSHLPKKVSWTNLDGATLEEAYSDWRTVNGKRLVSLHIPSKGIAPSVQIDYHHAALLKIGTSLLVRFIAYVFFPLGRREIPRNALTCFRNKVLATDRVSSYERLIVS